MTRYSKREVEEAFNHISKMLGFSEIFFHSNSFSSHGSKHLIFSSVGRFSAIFFYYLELIEMDWMAFKNSLDLMIRLKYLEYFLFASEKTPQSSSFFMYFLLANLYSINAVVDNVLIEWARDKISTLQGNTFYRLALASLSNIDKLSEEVAEFWKRDHFSLIFTHDLLLELVSRFFKLWTTHKSLFQPMFIFFRENGRFIASYFSRYPEILYGLKEIFQELSLFASPRKSPENDIFQLDVVGCCLVPTLKILISWKESNDECTKQDFVFFQRLFWLIASNEVLRESLSELLFFSTFDFVLNHCKKFNTFPFKSLEVAAIVPISRGHFFLKLMNLSASLYLKINTERTVLVFYHLLGIDISGLTKLALECTGSTESGEAAFYYWNLYKDLVASELLDYKDPPAKEIEMDSLKLLILSKLKSIDASCIDSIPFSGIYGLRNIVENFPTSLICSSSSLNSYFSANVSLDVLRTWDLPDLVSIERIRKMSDKDLAFEYLRNLTPLKMEESLELVTLRLESAARNDELRAQELSKFASFIKDDLLVKFEEAKWIYESSQNCMLAISWLKSALSPILCPSVESLKNISYQTRVKIIKSLAFLGKCASDTKSYRPHEIYDEYYKPLEFLLRIPSIASLGVIPESFSIGDTSTPLIRAQDIYFQLATFYDQQYESRISSSELQAWSSLLRSKAEELAALKCKRPVKGSSLERAINLMQIQLDNDRSSYEKILVDANTYLFKSIENYLNALLLRGTGVSAPCLLEISMNQVEISSAFRLCTLWIKHSDMLPISRLLQEFLLTPGFPWKSFMPLMYQIVARLENKVNPFQEALQCLVEGLLERFPYVSVFHLLYFKSKNPMSSDSSKAILVKEIIDKVKNKSAKLHSVLTEMELLISAYVELSTMDIKSVAIGGGSSNHSLEGTSLMRFLEHGKGNVPVLTGDFSAFFKGNPSYGESIQGITTIAAFRPTIKLVGGMNLPKVIDCVGSDGKIYRQLVKSKDDLRQDAIMSQLFCIFNGLFSHADQAPGFCVKTYKVIPLQPLSGVLEWLSSTMPVGDYLQETHERYGPSRPSELSPTQARVLAKKEFDHPRSTPTTKLEIYKEKILPRFHPVFRFFFYESAQASETWYTKRLTFTRSLAISSILGYIVGLGDRHTQNILLDLSTSEICQIDLNLIFEQGKLLKIPERVPFRLTPDFRDGLSFGGPYHGTFPKTCEAALTILRERKDLVLAILKVVEWDPLYKWQFVIEKTTSGATTKRTLGNTVVNDKKENYVYTTQQPAMLLAREMSCIAQQENPPYLDGCLTTPKCTQTQRQQGRLYDQNDMDTLQPINPEAERALLRVREKLQGLEEGNTLSVSAQTQYLIETAASESNLSQMYYGWQPWM